MEIDRAVKESNNTRLQTKYNNAVYVIQRAFALYSFEEVAFSFNGGKDSTVLLHLLRAGYFLHNEKANSSSENQINFKFNCPIRTIYFESPSAFPEINTFTYETASTYDLKMEIIRLDFKSGLEALLREKPIKAIFLGTRIGDPNAVGQEQFSPSSTGWPPFMRVNPILDWSYSSFVFGRMGIKVHPYNPDIYSNNPSYPTTGFLFGNAEKYIYLDVWAFLLTCKVKYCSLYDEGYTSIGSIHDTVPNALLCINDPSKSKENFKPAYLLQDGRLERAGRAKKNSPIPGVCVLRNGLNSADPHLSSTLTASIIAVGDEILFGTVEDKLGPTLCRKLHSIGWVVTRISLVRNDIDSVAEEVAQQKSNTDMVFMFGGVGPLHADVTLAGVAKAFGVRLAPDEEFEEYLNHFMGDEFTGDRNEMAMLPEGITELLHHEMLPVPLIKCQNVIILSATNVTELDKQWDCLLELTTANEPLVLLAPFVSKHLRTTLSDAVTRISSVKSAQTLLKFRLEFPDLFIGCYRESRTGPLIISFVGKDATRIDMAVQRLYQEFHSSAFSEVKRG